MWDSCLATKENGERIPGDVATLQCLPILFENVIKGALVFGAVVSIAFIIFAGIKFINSGGDPKQVDAARKTLTFAIVGFVIVLLAFFILNFISYATGVECIRTFGLNTCI